MTRHVGNIEEYLVAETDQNVAGSLSAGTHVKTGAVVGVQGAVAGPVPCLSGSRETPAVDLHPCRARLDS